MARKKKSTNKVVPVLVLAAILVGGYYWLTTDTSALSERSDLNALTQSSSDSTTVGNLSTEDAALVDSTVHSGADTVSNTENVTAQPELQSTPKATAKNAYVDEYGNVIYKQPNGKSPVNYKKAIMGRWGYEIMYPDFLTKETNTGDGRTFVNASGFKLTTYAAWNVFDESITDLYRKDISDVKSVTYKKLFRKQKYYVKSGYTKTNQIFYLKEALIHKDGQEVIATLVFYYPQSYQQEADKVVSKIFGNFPIVRK